MAARCTDPALRVPALPVTTGRQRRRANLMYSVSRIETTCCGVMVLPTMRDASLAMRVDVSVSINSSKASSALPFE